METLLKRKEVAETNARMLELSQDPTFGLLQRKMGREAPKDCSCVDLLLVGGRFQLVRDMILVPSSLQVID